MPIATRILAAALCAAAGLFAQQPVSSTGTSGTKLANLLTQFFDSQLQGLGPGLMSAFQQSVAPNVNLSSQNAAIAAELSNLPVPSPASALRYTYDPELGVYVPSVQSLGPILTERAETIGKDKFFFAVTFQRFQFDRLDELDFRNFNLKIPVPIGGGVQATVDANVSASLIVDQTTAHFTYGVTHWLDASLAAPIVTTSLSFNVRATAGLGGATILTVNSTVAGSATGIGDVLIRMKAKLAREGRLRFGMGGDFRIPTGDEFNYHGAGAFGVKPFLIASLTSKRLSPHLNAGYQWNGKSFLASSTGTQKESLPGQLFYAVGADTSLTPRMTVACDLLDQIIIHGRRTFVRTQDIGGTSYSTVYFPNLSRHEVNAAAGLKARLGRDIVFTGNLLFRLNSAGLRSRVVPLFGLSYIY
jgi:hypothetical protein